MYPKNIQLARSIASIAGNVLVGVLSLMKNLSHTGALHMSAVP